MPRFNVNKLAKAERAETVNLFYEAVKTLKSKQDIVDFFHDLLTESESVMLARRLQIARMILDGLMFHEIREELGASNDTINTVKRFLDFGQKGYQKVVERLPRR